MASLLGTVNQDFKIALAPALPTMVSLVGTATSFVLSFSCLSWCSLISSTVKFRTMANSAG